MLFLHLFVRFFVSKNIIVFHKSNVLRCLHPYLQLTTKLHSSSIVSPPSSPLSSSISTSLSSSSSPQLSLNPPSSLSSSVSFYFSSTSEVRVSPSYLNSSVFFLTTCFLLLTGFRCNILLANIYTDLLLLALVCLKNFSTFNK